METKIAKCMELIMIGSKLQEWEEVRKLVNLLKDLNFETKNQTVVEFIEVTELQLGMRNI